jgi:hypothetical protein
MAMIPDDEPFKYQPVAQPKPHTDECLDWLEANEPRPFGYEF